MVRPRHARWFLAEGWALTPETSGVAASDKKGPGENQAIGYIRRRPGAMQMMIGGRNLGKPSDPVVRFIVALDGRTLETFEVAPSPGFFLRSLDAARWRPDGRVERDAHGSGPGSGIRSWRGRRCECWRGF